MTSCNVPHKIQEMPADSSLSKATFAGGCFWCIEAEFEKISGVKAVIAGYSGGKEQNPTYEQVCSGRTGHVEAVQVFYDSKFVSYEKLLGVFWHSIDPTDDGGQFADRGSQYVSVIFYHDETQRKLAEQSKKEIQTFFDKSVVAKIKEFTNFYPAEDYHQAYHKKNSLQYKAYRSGSGRDVFLKTQWTPSVL